MTLIAHKNAHCWIFEEMKETVCGNWSHNKSKHKISSQLNKACTAKSFNDLNPLKGKNIKYHWEVKLRQVEHLCDLCLMEAKMTGSSLLNHLAVNNIEPIKSSLLMIYHVYSCVISLWKVNNKRPWNK